MSAGEKEGVLGAVGARARAAAAGAAVEAAFLALASDYVELERSEWGRRVLADLGSRFDPVLGRFVEKDGYNPQAAAKRDGKAEVVAYVQAMVKAGREAAEKGR